MSVSSIALKTKQPSVPKPYWTMQIIYNEGEVVEVVKDSEREVVLKGVKSSWWAQKITRSNRALEIRWVDYNGYKNIRKKLP